MKRALISGLVLMIAVTFISCKGRGGTSSTETSPKGTGKTLVKVGNAKITEGDVELLGRINPRIKAQLTTEFGKKKILDNLVDQELLYQAAVDEGLQNDPIVKDKIDIYRKVIISQSYLDKQLEEAAKKYYEENKDSFNKLKMSHIMIRYNTGKNSKVKRSKKEALELANKAKERITGGEEFADVAKEVSEDDMTKKRGGDLGYVAKNEARLTRRGYGPIIEKAYTMKADEVSGPIETEGAYHVIIVTESPKLQSFDDVVQNIMFKIRVNERNKVLAELKKKNKVKFIEEKKKAEKEVEKKEAVKKEEIKKTEKVEEKTKAAN